MATVTIKHASLTGAAANPDVLVDGPKWDASHTVTGLENVDNTSDADKPISTATQTALDTKAHTFTLTTTGSSGPATYTSDVLNIPQYSGATIGGSSGQGQYNNAGAFGGYTVSGDMTANFTTGAFTLATVNPNVGSFGSATASANFTVDGKGRLTAAGSSTITPAVGSITGLGTGVSTFLATPSSANLRAALTDEVGTGAAYFVGGALGTPASGTLTSCTAFTLTTTGSSGAATYSGGALNIPQYSGGSSFSGNVVATGSARTVVSTDNQKLVLRSNSGTPMQDTLPGTSPGVLAANTIITLKNADASALYAISAGTGATLDGVSTNFILLGPGQSAQVASDGSNYFTVSAPKRAQPALNSLPTIYVATSGSSDLNSGITSSVPFSTIQAALNYIFTRMDHGGSQINIQLATTGTYAGFSIRGGLTGHFGNPANSITTFNITGDIANANLYIIDGGANPAVETILGKSIHLFGVTLQSTSSYAIRNYGTGGEVVFGSVNFGTCGAGHVYVGDGAIIRQGGNVTVTGDAPFLINADKGGIYESPSATTITFSGTRAFSNAVLFASTGGIISTDNITWSVGGTVSGQMWKRDTAGIIRPNANAVLDALFAGPTSGVTSDYIASVGLDVAGAGACTITIASPAVVNYPSTTLPCTANSTIPVKFSTTGALPTGIVAGTQYWVIGSSIVGTTFKIATSIANALAGTAINTSGSQSGTHTITPALAMTTATPASIGAISIPVGDWEVDCVIYYRPAATTSITNYLASVSKVLDTIDSNFAGTEAQNIFAATITGGPYMTEKLPPQRFSVSATTTIHLVAQAAFTVSTLTSFGILRARRAVC